MPFWTSFALFSFCDPTSPDLRSPSPIISPNYNPNFTFPAGDETKEAIAGNPLINARDTLADEGTSLIEEVVIIEEGEMRQKRSVSRRVNGLGLESVVDEQSEWIRSIH